MAIRDITRLCKQNMWQVSYNYLKSELSGGNVDSREVSQWGKLGVVVILQKAGTIFLMAKNSPNE